ncbi:restriction endonuclease [Patescibacteria group bacterium]|nr:restriction endonuclease [Patescibacteria group bacterium]
MSIVISKADGTTQQFDRNKLFSSLKRSGAATDMAEEITQEIEKNVLSGATTQEIYSRAFAHLKRHKHGAAARYSLKLAILNFGPSGFPFESYIAELFRAEGYKTKVDQIVRGACVEHEVDVVIDKKTETVYAEVKFHNTAGFKTDLKTALYVEARIEDIAAYHRSTIARGLLVTNTKFTTYATGYARCKGLELLGWEYPQGATLQDRIDKAGLYPVTALTTLNNREKTALLKDRVVLCRALPEETEALTRAGISGRKADRVMEEVGALCTPRVGI